MYRFISIIKGNYFQQIRSYTFLIVVALSIYAAFSFIPGKDANYSTIRFGNYSGVYNSSWIGYVTAIMSSIFLSLFGFFLINGAIKKDIDTKIGQIFGTTQISNFGYLFAKAMSNFIILLTILICIFLISILMFFIYTDGLPFQISEFLIPYLLIPLPAIFFIAFFAVLIEVFFTQKVFIQYAIFLFSFMGLVFYTPKNEKMIVSDPFGFSYPTKVMENQIQKLHQGEKTEISIGFISGGINPEHLITFNGLELPAWFILKRVFWMVFSSVLLFFSSFVFHRFNVKEKQRLDKKENPIIKEKSAGFKISNLNEGSIQTSFGILPLIKAEIKMLLRKNTSFFWILTGGGIIALIFSPISIAHKYILPILWFLQVTNWSDLVTKDKAYRTHYFAASSYNPMKRLFIARIVSGIALALFIALPLLIRLLFSLNFTALASIIIGAVFIVMLAIFLGVITQSKKLFEVTFLFLTYCSINLVPFTDYYGSSHTSINYIFSMTILVLALFLGSYFIKKLRYE